MSANISDNKKTRQGFYSVLKGIVILLIVYSVAMGLSLIPQGASDAPCEYLYGNYRDAGACFEAWGNAPRDFAGASQIEAFITTYHVSTSGGGCYHDKTISSLLDIQRSSFNVHITIDDNGLKINNADLAVGAEFQAVDYSPINPWIVSRLNLKYYGEIPTCNDTAAASRALVMGSQGTEFSILKGGLIALILIRGLAFVNRKLKSINEKT